MRLLLNHAEAHNNLGILLAKQGKLKEARRHYSEALRLNPDSAEIHNNLAGALVKLEEIEAATEQYQKALEIKPHDAGIHHTQQFWNLFGTAGQA
jgi:Flp pilus assembly protein TadD